jgi:hypothetical protein
VGRTAATIEMGGCGPASRRILSAAHGQGKERRSDIIAAMPQGASEKKRFTYDEAARLLPEVRRITDAAYRAVDSASEDAASTEQTQARVEALVTRWAQDVMALGLEVKGLWLVDFDSGAGYYCWKYPEPGLDHFHGYEEGFAGRLKLT